MVQKVAPKRLLLSSPHGFCAGVRRADEALRKAIESYPEEIIYCYHQIVHNVYVVNEFQSKGVKFVSSIEEVPDESIVVFSSHGVSPEIRQYAINHKLKTIDATCPFVTKTHLELKKYVSEGDKIIYIGQPNHDEAVGTTGEAPESTTIVQTEEEIEKLPYPSTTPTALITQTTLSYDETNDLRKALRGKFPNLIEPSVSDICMATQNRQSGVKELVKEGAEIVIVLGSINSSNSNKLKKVAEKAGAKAVLVDNITELDITLLGDAETVGLTAGASVPEHKISEAITWFKSHGTIEVKEVMVADETRINLAPVKVD